MARLTSCWDGSVALMLLILLLLAATIDRTVVAGKVIFPDAESCTLNNGETGHCVPLLDCPSVLQTFKERPPVQCGFEGFTQIVCCPKGQDTTTESSQNIVDISPPSDYYTLDCGISATKIIETFGPGFGPSVSRASRSIRPSIKEVPKAVEATPQVVGGRISKRAAWPWMALVGQRDAVGIDWFCGGALINEHWVLSALHCFHDFKADVVRLGEYNYENDNDGADHKDFGVAELVLYPDYKYPQAYHDLALLRLDRKVTLQKFILPVCLPWGNKSEESIVDNVATIVGWGNTLFGGFPSSVLMEAKLQVFPSPRCNSTYSTLPYYSNTWPHGIGEETLCAGDPDGGKDACQGDSGGPLITRDTRGHYVAAGIVSRGYGCGLKDYPGLYANLRNPPYLAWIKKVAFGLK